MDLTRFDRNLLKSQFLNAEPFNYVMIDNFIDPHLLKSAENEMRGMNPSDWIDKTTAYSNINNQADTITQSKKVALNIRSQIKEKSLVVINLFESPEFLKFIEDITGINNLQSDPALLGGGIHKSETGGHLSIHADYNIHPDTGKHRRINALLYVNSDWKPEYNGELELWSKDMMKCVQKIPPIFNRLVIFRITDDAYHGWPQPWMGPLNYARLSFAFYYFTDDRPENEKSPFHWAAWQKRFGVIY